MSASAPAPGPQTTRVLVAGTGALACALGARLARAGTAVTLTGKWREALDAIASRGIVVYEAGAAAQPRWSARAAAVRLDQLAEAFPLALVLVKSHQTPSVARTLARVLPPSGLAVTLQNGLGNREALAACLGPGRVAAGVAIMGAAVLAPGEVSAVAGRVILGEEPATAARVRDLALLLRSAGVASELTTALEPAVWRKLVANCAINPLTALHGMTNGALLEDPELRTQLGAVAREVGAVAAAKGITLGAEPAQLAIEVARATAANRSSMLQDLARGARTEIDALNGAVVLEGRRLGVATPANERLVREVRAREGRSLDAEGGA